MRKLILMMSAITLITVVLYTPVMALPIEDMGEVDGIGYFRDMTGRVWVDVYAFGTGTFEEMAEEVEAHGLNMATSEEVHDLFWLISMHDDHIMYDGDTIFEEMKAMGALIESVPVGYGRSEINTYAFGWTNDLWGADVNLIQSHIYESPDIGLYKPTTDWYSTYPSMNNNSGVWAYTDTPVPEPCTLILLGTGIAGLVAYRRKKRK